MKKLTIAIEGMTCGHRVRQIDGALRRLKGVQVQAVRVGEAFVAYDPTSVSEQEIAQAIHGLGYHWYFFLSQRPMVPADRRDHGNVVARSSGTRTKS